MRKIVLLFVSLLLGLQTGSAAIAHAGGHTGEIDWAERSVVALSPPQVVLPPEVLRVLSETPPNEYVPVIVTLREQAEWPSLLRVFSGRRDARLRLITQLQAVAERTQTPLLVRLEQMQAAGEVQSFTPFWIFNGLAVRARPATVRALAQDPMVATVQIDHYRRWVEDRRSTASLSWTPSALPEWGVSRIRADQVWATLNISGTGIVVAGMDTGVDWLHPALQRNYRGYNPRGPSLHTYSWFDAVNRSHYPFDDHGHGTHTLGTAVGQDGIGVAPGAKWIAVKVLDRYGYGYDSWIHAGFQWLLAPGGDPSKAPDVVNCSWGNPNGALTTFENDLRLLRAVGIVPVFANGNGGPREGTVFSPASLPEAFAVGASDPYDLVASFSSRGPSPWNEIRPHVVAPGVVVRSSLPGGLYGNMSGTSMAAPHVSGLVALLRSVSPTLSITHTLHLITSTAVPVGAPLPNNTAGWGRVDAFAAVAMVVRAGWLTGTVRRADTNAPIAGAEVSACSRDPQPITARTTTDAQGWFTLTLRSGLYDVTAAAFGYVPATQGGVWVEVGKGAVLSFSLAALPTGTLRAHVATTASLPLTATLTVSGTPLQATAAAVDFALPAGTYTLRAYRLGFRVVTATAAVTVGQVSTVMLTLPAIPKLLLVDSGAWYYESQAYYYRTALDDLAYSYAEWPITGTNVPERIPGAADLAPYDVVIWSAPHDAPGYIGASGAITNYLKSGGRLLISGQDIGYLENSEQGDYRYYRDYLKARFVQDDAGSRSLFGTPGELFAGLAITITGAGGADNQDYPDEIAPADPDSAASVWTYASGSCGGIRASTCLGYRVLYFSFGFEAINDRAMRREVLSRALDWLAAPAPTTGVELVPAATLRIGPPGTIVTHTVRLRHVGQGGATDSISLTLSGADWETTLSPTLVTLAPCAAVSVEVRVSVPLTAAWNARDVVTLTAQSVGDPSASASITLTTKTPAPLLLVDGDRWYDQQPKYRAVLDALATPYDLWEVNPASGGRRSPPAERLRWYPLLVWWTGYDWYQPLTPAEELSLRQYLDSGGRLFLSSQDLLMVQADSLLAQRYLGVLHYAESVTPTAVQGTFEHPVGEGLPLTVLERPFTNWADTVEPTPGTAVVLRDQGSRGVGLARRGSSFATVFLSFPFEALPEAQRYSVMEQAVGWLSWLGSSTWRATPATIEAGERATFTLVLQNDGPVPVRVSISNTLPSVLSLDGGSIHGPLLYTPALRLVSWRGELEPRTPLTLSYAVTTGIDIPAGTVVHNVAQLALEEHAIRFRRVARLRVATPDLSATSFEVPPRVRSGKPATYTLWLTNNGLSDTALSTATIRLPQGMRCVTDSLYASSGTLEVLTDALRWSGPLGRSEAVSVTCAIQPISPRVTTLYAVALVEDGWGMEWERPAWLSIEPWRHILPMIFRIGTPQGEQG